MTNTPNRLSDGYLEVSAGIDSGKSPNLIAKNAMAFAINATVRGGWAKPRPGWRKITLNYNDDYYVQSAFKDALFQTAEPYVSFADNGSLISMHSGRVFLVNVQTNGTTFPVQEITIPGDPNPANLTQAWGIQAGNFFLLQDGQTKPFIWNGGSSRRATETEIPVGRQMSYYMGRIWTANGRDYVAGDIVFGPPNNDRSSILKMTENQYIAEGGAFSIPAQSGDIVAMEPIANINTVLGQGELILFTQNAVFATLVPQDRAQWKTTTQPLQRMIQLANGGVSQASVINVNEDLFYRAPDGIRSLAFSVRNAGQLGNTAISNEMVRILRNDPQGFMQYCSGVNFDDRLLMTSSPGLAAGRGTYFRCLCALDFDPIMGMTAKEPPAWEGIWTGLRFLKVVTVRHQRVQRCFIYALNASDEIELWELTKGDESDHDGTVDVPIQWTQESRAFDFGTKFGMKEITGGDLFFDNVSGQCDFTLEYRPDGYPCWVPWESWSECAKNKICLDEFGSCPTLPNFQPQYRPQRQLTQPPDTFDPIVLRKHRTGFEFETRLTITGYARVKQMRLNAQPLVEPPHGRQL